MKVRGNLGGVGHQIYLYGKSRLIAGDVLRDHIWQGTPIYGVKMQAQGHLFQLNGMVRTLLNEMAWCGQMPAFKLQHWCVVATEVSAANAGKKSSLERKLGEIIYLILTDPTIHIHPDPSLGFESAWVFGGSYLLTWTLFSAGVV